MLRFCCQGGLSLTLSNDLSPGKREKRSATAVYLPGAGVSAAAGIMKRKPLPLCVCNTWKGREIKRNNTAAAVSVIYNHALAVCGSVPAACLSLLQLTRCANLTGIPPLKKWKVRKKRRENKTATHVAITGLQTYNFLPIPPPPPYRECWWGECLA